MRIGLVCPYALTVPGGAQNHVLELARELALRGHHIGVLASGERPLGAPAYVETTGSAVSIGYNGSIARVALGPRVAAKTRRWLQVGRYDVVHVHEPFAPSVSILAAWLSDVPVVATFHTASARSRSMRAASPLLAATMARIDARIAVSESARSRLVEHVGGEPLVIPNGISCAAFGDRPRGHDDAPVVAFLGRVGERRKGLWTLLDAWPAIRACHPGAVLKVAGPGSLELLGSHDSRTGIGAIGQPTDAARAALLAEADVFVAPQTHGESFGIVLIEALASGTAVAASDIAAFRAVLDDGRLGQLFEPGNAAALAGAVSAVLADAGRRTQLERAGIEAAQRFDWSVVVPEIEAVYAMVTQPAAEAMRAHLRRRSEIVLHLALEMSDRPDVTSLASSAAATRSEIDESPNWRAESELTAALNRLGRDDPDLSPRLVEIAEAQRRASHARRIHNDSVAVARGLRGGRRVRRPPALDHLLATIEYDDGTL